ncbi:MAG: hypothetical protein JWO38_1113 [Gemmataceae bacterium]|nr:hypothetical protein [Gemmataceae bacterium]
MRLRRLVWLIPAALLILVGASVLVPVQYPPSRITQENFDRIQDGMSEAEVEEILGPPGYYNHNPYVVFESGISFRRYWLGDEGFVIIEVTWPEDPPTWLPLPHNRTRRVYRKEFHPVPPESYGERWYRQLRWSRW